MGYVPRAPHAQIYFFKRVTSRVQNEPKLSSIHACCRIRSTAGSSEAVECIYTPGVYAVVACSSVTKATGMAGVAAAKTGIGDVDWPWSKR